MKYFFKNNLVSSVPIKLIINNLDNIRIYNQISNLLLRAYKIKILKKPYSKKMIKI